MKTTNWFSRLAGAAVVALAMAGCVQSAPEVPTAEVDWDNVKFNVAVSVAATGADGAQTRAVKSEWAEGDRIVAFFEGNALRFVELQYNGAAWTRQLLSATGAAAEGTMLALHAGGANSNDIAGDLLYTPTDDAGSYAYDAGTNTVGITLALTRPLTVIRVAGAEGAEENAKWRLAGTGIKAPLNGVSIVASAFTAYPTGTLAGLFEATAIGGTTATPNELFTDDTEAVFMVWWDGGTDDVKLKMYKDGAPETVYTRTYKASTFTVGKAAPIDGPASSDPDEADEWYEVPAVSVPVQSITGVPTTGTAGVVLLLNGFGSGATVVPDDATNQTILWSVSDAGNTGVEGISHEYPLGKLITFVKPTAAGTLKVLATITNGKAAGVDYTEEFTIEIAPAAPDPDADILTAENFPDTNFRTWLTTQATSTWGDTNGELTADEAAEVTGALDVPYKSIASLVGIAYFTGLTGLYCDGNTLTTLDVSALTALTELSCSGNTLTSLDVSNNTALTGLYCDGNKLTALDVTNNTALTRLNCYNNSLATLDVSNNTALTRLECYNNKLTKLNVSANTALKVLLCHTNALTALNVSGCTQLTDLHCYSNQLTTLNVSANTALTTLDCGYNQLYALNVTNNTALTGLYCRGNVLTSLNVSANTALTSLYCWGNSLTSLNVSGCTELGRLYCYNNSLAALDVSNNAKLFVLSCEGNPGNRESKFPVKVWAAFTTPPGGFTTAAWDYTINSFSKVSIAPEYSTQ